jgi:hypothetical protein
LLFSSFLGSIGFDDPRDIAIDSEGNTIVVGDTVLSGFPILNAYQPERDLHEDGFITKVSGTGELLFSTFFGGNHIDECRRVYVDSNDDIFVTGYTRSTNFHLNNSFQNESNGNYTAFISKLTADGQELNFSSYLGGENQDYGHDMFIDENIVISAGITTSTDFPVVNAYQDSLAGGRDTYLCKFNVSKLPLQTTPTDTGGYAISTVIIFSTLSLLIVIAWKKKLYPKSNIWR